MNILLRTLLYALFIAIIGKSAYSQRNSENGYSIPVSGTIKVLFVFAEVTSNFTQPSSIPGFGEGELPPDHSDYFDATYTPGVEPTAYISKYFYQQSMGSYIVLGDHLDHVMQVNPGVTDGYTRVFEYINSLMNANTFNTRLLNGSPNSDFDQWDIPSSNFYGYPKSNASNNKVDVIIILWKNHPFYTSACYKIIS